MNNIENIKSFLRKIRDTSGMDLIEDGLFSFGEEVSMMLLESISAIRELHKKERLRAIIKDVFELDNKDVVVFRHNEIFIKRFNGKFSIQPQVFEKIKEELAILFAGSESPIIINDTLTIPTDRLLSELGITIESLTVDEKESLKQKLKKHLGLCDKDLIIFLNDKVVIKKFKSPIDETVVKRERRFNGLPKEELELLRSSIFESPEAEEQIFIDVIEAALESELNFGSITQEFFVKNYIKILQKAIFDFLNENLTEDSAALDGLSSLLLREHWILIHTKMASKILELIGQRNLNTENFLKKYSGEIEVDHEHNKYKQPDILDKSGIRWGVPSIVSVAMQRKKALESLEKKHKIIHDLKKEIIELQHSVEKVDEECMQLDHEMAAVQKELDLIGESESVINFEIKALRDLLKKSKDEDKKEIQSKISEKTLSLKRIVIQEEGIFGRRKKLEQQHKITASKSDKIKFEISKLQKRQKDEEEKIVQFVKSQYGVEEKYELLTEAVAIALMKRKVKI